MMLRRFMSPRERSDAEGKKISFTVIRDGQRVERVGTVTRVTATAIWLGAWLYDLDELQRVREVQ